MTNFKSAIMTREKTMKALNVDTLIEMIQHDIDVAAEAGRWKTYYIDTSVGTEVWIYLKRRLEVQDYIVGEITKDYELVGLEIKWMVYK